MRQEFFHIVAFGSIFGLAAPGCIATVQPDPVYAEATYVPPRIETYPSVVYEGRPVYYVDGYWYVHEGPGWMYYRQEPPELYRQRPYVQQAPPAYHAPTHPAPAQPAPPVQAAPPATRVR